MIETGLFEGVDVLSGGSAGAVTAALMAVGMPPTAFRDKLLHTNFKDLMDASVSSL